jgi:cytochrome P450
MSSIKSWLVNPPHWILWLLRTFWPIPRLFGWASVFRYEHVANVLTRHDIFKVPFDKEIARLNDGHAPGTPFILGIDDTGAHDAQLALVMRAFKREDVPKIVVPICRAATARRIPGAPGEFDAIQDLVTAVPLDICEEYYGVPISDRQRFAYATIDVSGHLFGPPPIEPKAEIDKAADYVREIVDAAIQKEMNGQAPPQPWDTIVKILVLMHKKVPPELSYEEIRAFLIGMIVGFVPTNTMAGGHILEMLLRKPKFMQASREAALQGDDDLLQHCLFEAMRWMPLNPGPFRICDRDYVVAADTRRAATIRKGTKVLASTMSAMFDCRQVKHPFKFDPARPASDYMLFGYGIHWCVGLFIARAQIVETFKPLLKRGMRRAPGERGKLKLRGTFPDHLFVEVD